MSETLAARTGCYDLVNRRWSDEALAFAEAPPLPRLLKTGEIAGTAGPGRLREAGAVSSSTLIVAGGHDHPIASSAILRLNAEARIDSLGTANALYGETRVASPHIDDSLEATVPAMCGDGLALVGVTEFTATLDAKYGKSAPQGTPAIAAASGRTKRHTAMTRPPASAARWKTWPCEGGTSCRASTAPAFREANSMRPVAGRARRP